MHCDGEPSPGGGGNGEEGRGGTVVVAADLEKVSKDNCLSSKEGEEGSTIPKKQEQSSIKQKRREAAPPDLQQPTPCADRGAITLRSPSCLVAWSGVQTSVCHWGQKRRRSRSKTVPGAESRRATLPSIPTCSPSAEYQVKEGGPNKTVPRLHNCRVRAKVKRVLHVRAFT